MDQLCIDKELSETGCNLISFGLYFGYLLFGVALISAIVLPLINTIKNPRNLVKAGVGVGVLVVVFLIAFAVSGDEVTTIGKGLGLTPFGSQMIGAGLIVFYVALIGAALGLIYSEVSKAFK
jgi:hypothetical protein